MKIDYLIVGQGLAGSLLSFELHTRGKKIKVVDNFYASSASLVAAGLYNPIVFRRFIESWMSKDLIPELDEVYTRLESSLSKTFHYKKDIFKVFTSDLDLQAWNKKSKETTYLNFCEEPAHKLNDVENEFGGATVNSSGWLDVSLFLKTYRSFLTEQNLLVEDHFNTEDVIVGKDQASWKAIVADKIIFCEGSAAVANPFFSWLPFKLTKGELITIKCLDLPETYVVNKGVFILPIGDSCFKVGATYDWHDLSIQTTEKGKNELLLKLNKLIKYPYQIIDHQAGVRPTVSDRRPLIGLHPEYDSLAVFNGLGTKGVMLGPYFAKQFADNLIVGAPLNEEAAVSRYYKFYNNS